MLRATVAKVENRLAAAIFVFYKVKPPLKLHAKQHNGAMICHGSIWEEITVFQDNDHREQVHVVKIAGAVYVLTIVVAVDKLVYLLHTIQAAADSLHGALMADAVADHQAQAD
mgnify:FL=1